jgi:hypothetical protein
MSIDALDVTGPDGGPAVRVHGVLVDLRPRGVHEGLHHDGDAIHHLEVTLTVGFPDHVIRAVEAAMRTVPYPTLCPDALPSLQSLVGVSVARGFTRAVQERLGRERGCTHVVALILAMGPVVRQGAGAAYGFAAADGGAPADPDRPWFVNSCQAWREHGPLHAAWRAGRQAPAD